MPATHIVQVGEHLGTIARKYGFANYSPLWDHPENAPLKKLRENPMLLAPGDRVFIPDRVQLAFNRVTEASHDFRVHVDTLSLKLRLLGEDGKPRKNASVTIRVEPPETGGASLQREQVLTTDGDGILKVDVASHVGEGSIQIDGVEYALHIGALDPIDTPRGVAQRLSNLGYLAAGAEPDPIGLRLAIEEFQADQGLAVTGEAADIEAKLEDAYGS